MKYHVYFFDKFGTPAISVQMEDKDGAIAMMMKHAGAKHTPVPKCEFKVSEEHTVLIFVDVI